MGNLPNITFACPPHALLTVLRQSNARKTQNICNHGSILGNLLMCLQSADIPLLIIILKHLITNIYTHVSGNFKTETQNSHWKRNLNLQEPIGHNFSSLDVSVFILISYEHTVLNHPLVSGSSQSVPFFSP